MTTALISLGANTPGKHATLTDTIERIKELAQVTALTPVYETPAEGSIAAAPYANALLQISTNIDYHTLHDTFKEWEQVAGRTRESKLQGIIPLDIDIIMWDGNILKERDMQMAYMQEGLQLLTHI